MTNEQTNSLDQLAEHLRSGNSPPFALWRMVQSLQKHDAEGDGKDAQTKLLIHEYCRLTRAAWQCVKARTN